MNSVIESPLRYPFEIVRNSFAIVDGHVQHAARSFIVQNHRLDARTIFSLIAKEIVAVPVISDPIGILTCGSNASPARLAEKMIASKRGDALALRLSLSGWVPVYAATLSYYGAVPATFARIPDAAAEPFLIIMDRSSLTGVIESEQRTGNYDLYRVEPDSTAIRADYPIFAFVAKNGVLQLDGDIVCVREFQPDAVAAALPTQRDIVARLLQITGRSSDLSEYESRIGDQTFLAHFRADIRSKFYADSDVSGWRLLDARANFSEPVFDR